MGQGLNGVVSHDGANSISPNPATRHVPGLTGTPVVLPPSLLNRVSPNCAKHDLSRMTPVSNFTLENERGRFRVYEEAPDFRPGPRSGHVGNKGGREENMKKEKRQGRAPARAVRSTARQPAPIHRGAKWNLKHNCESSCLVF